MNTLNQDRLRFTGVLAATAIMCFAVASCATAPQSPPGYAEVHSKLTSLKSDPNLGTRAPVEIREAEAAVQAAETPVPKDAALGEHRVYLADRKVEIAMAKASTRYAEDQREGLSRQSTQVRLDARTREADEAQSQVDISQAAAAVAAVEAASKSKELQRQIDVLQAEATDRGLVLTLGNVLFATGQANLMAGGVTSLDKLVVFLNEYPDRDVAIEGHTDDVGSADLNQSLSQNRAESVKTYLMQQGIQTSRLTSAGLGETQPVADNNSESGRQQNRRVEVIIENPTSAVPTAATQ